MSQWATVEAEFEGVREHAVTPEWPHSVGSEGGPDTGVEGRALVVSGRLRDVFDASDSAAVLAWWCEAVDLLGPDSATLVLDYDDGPKYRYRFDGQSIERLRGVLEL